MRARLFAAGGALEVHASSSGALLTATLPLTVRRVIRVVVAEDQALVLDALAALLALEDDIEVVGRARDGAAALEAVADLKPDVLVSDIEMPGLTGIEVAERLKVVGQPHPRGDRHHLWPRRLPASRPRRRRAWLPAQGWPQRRPSRCGAQGRGGRQGHRSGTRRSGLGRRSRSPHRTRALGPTDGRGGRLQQGDRRERWACHPARSATISPKRRRSSEPAAASRPAASRGRTGGCRRVPNLFQIRTSAFPAFPRTDRPRRA